MQSPLQDPVVQAGIAPLIAGFVVAAVLGRARLGGLAIAAGFVLGVALVSGLALAPLTAIRKLTLFAFVAPVMGLSLDFFLTRGRALTLNVALVCGALSVWVFWSVVQQKPVPEAVLVGGSSALFVAWVVATTLDLSAQPVRAGSAALALGLGVGVTAILGASASLGFYGIALAAGAGGFLLWQMLTGRPIAAGATLTLPASVASSLIAVAGTLLALVPWYALPALALIPLAARLPAPERLPVWAQAIIVSSYGFAVACLAFVLTWRAAKPSG